MELRNDYILKKEFAEIRQVGKEKQDNCIRVYCSDYPDGFKFQIRTFKPITDMGEGVPRQMMASVNLTIKEVEEILDYMKKESTKYEA